MIAPAIVRLAVAAALLAAVGSCLDRPFVCRSHAECAAAGAEALCESNQRCSVRDRSCPSQRRYVEYGTDGRCVAGPPCGGDGQGCCALATCSAGLRCADGLCTSAPAPACGTPGGPCCAGAQCGAGLTCEADRCTCRVLSVAAGDNHTCAALSTGQVSCWGNNTTGQLGDGTVLSRAEARPVLELADAVEVATRGGHVCARLANGQAACWGSNNRGQLGDGSSMSRATAKLVPRLDAVAQIAVGARHSCARRNDGTVLCWGDNNRGQLGDGTLFERPVPTPVPGLTNVREIVAGDELTCVRHGGASEAEATVSCWGANGRHEVSVGDEAYVWLPRPVDGAAGAVALAAGGSHTCARLATGALVCWGYNLQGQLGREGSMTFAPGPARDLVATGVLAAGGSHTCALAAEGVRCFGSNDSAQLGAADSALGRTPPWPVAFASATALAAGGRHTCAVLADGSLGCIGDRSDGQLADAYPVVATRPTMTAVRDAIVEARGGNGYTCARTVAGQVLCWGASNYNRLGARSAPPHEPAVVPGIENAAQLAVGTDHACVRRQDGVVLCWGRGEYGQLGNGETKGGARVLTTKLSEAAVDVAVGAMHACAALASGKVRCWGRNSRQQVGDAGAGVEAQPTPFEVPGVGGAAAVAVGDNHSCARTSDKRVLCWGAGDYGQLGSPLRPMSAAPVAVIGADGAVDLVSGAAHLCLRTESGAVRCWGAGSGGQLGAAVVTDRNPRPLDVVDLDEPATGLAAGAAFTCARFASGKVRCWGQNRSGEVGDGSLDPRAVPSAPLTIAPVTTIGAGSAHVCGVTGGQLHCWGRNGSGELGLGAPTTTPVAKPVALGCR